MRAHGVDQRQAVGEVRLEEERRIRDGELDGRFGGEVDDRVDRFLPEHLGERRRITDAALDEAAALGDGRAMAEAEVVDDDDLVAGGLGEFSDDGADVAGSSRDEQFHEQSVLE